MTNTNTTGFGLTTWDEQNQTSKPQDQSDITKIDFVRLKEGNNSLRIITAPAKYWFVKFDDGKSQYGRRVNCAFPSVERSECPTVKAGYKPKKRYLTGVIVRNAEGEDEVMLFDMSVLVYEQLQAFKEDVEVGTPDQYDINVRFNPKAGSPGGFYTVIPRQRKPLSEEDQALIDDVGMETISDNLTRLCTPPSVERVEGFLNKLGWDGSSKSEAASDGGSSGGNLQEATPSNYSFDKPAAGV
jgi:hypothetical protein